MSGFLLDTNFVSEAVKAEPNPNVLGWLDRADENLLFLSVLTLGEIRKGLGGLPQGSRRSLLESWLAVDLRSRFEGRILPIDVEIADRWGFLSAETRKQGRTASVIDGLLAATALHHNLTLVTRNESDFASMQVKVLNPWKV